MNLCQLAGTGRSLRDLTSDQINFGVNDISASPRILILKLPIDQALFCVCGLAKKECTILRMPLHFDPLQYMIWTHIFSSNLSDSPFLIAAIPNFELPCSQKFFNVVSDNTNDRSFIPNMSQGSQELLSKFDLILRTHALLHSIDVVTA